MNITPTPEVVTEIAARGICLLHNYFYWKSEYELTGDVQNKIQMDKWEVRVHDLLKGLGADQWMSLKDLIYHLTIKTD